MTDDALPPRSYRDAPLGYSSGRVEQNSSDEQTSKARPSPHALQSTFSGDHRRPTSVHLSTAHAYPPAVHYAYGYAPFDTSALSTALPSNLPSGYEHAPQAHQQSPQMQFNPFAGQQNLSFQTPAGRQQYQGEPVNLASPQTHQPNEQLSYTNPAFQHPYSHWAAIPSQQGRYADSSHGDGMSSDPMRPAPSQLAAAVYAQRYRSEPPTFSMDPRAYQSGASTQPSIPSWNSGHYNTTQTNILRGPPRKPRQSGHALWVGNLPSSATIIDLKDHFSREATNTIESMKLISKSNCAFVNYSTAEACQAALARFHDSQFLTTKLVCRMRRASTPSTTPETASAESDLDLASRTAVGTSPVQLAHAKPEIKSPGDVESKPANRSPERFFILKSLTLEDLETSTQTGQWATQAHNEAPLNEAFESSNSVFLVFSANKSGEYFGYARMTSAIPTLAPVTSPTISENSTRTTQTSQALSQVDNGGLLSIPTPATEWAPKGRIIDDSARGTIFWEADRDETQVEPEGSDAGKDKISADGKSSPGPVIAFSSFSPKDKTAQMHDEDVQYSRGNSFRLEWISCRKVPFYKTRGLRNLWNANREIKIARDGTEIEPSVAKRLLSLFGSSPSANITSPPR